MPGMWCRFLSGRQSTCIPLASLVAMADELVAYSCLAWSEPWKFGLLPATGGTIVSAECLTYLSSGLWSSMPISQPHQQTTALNSEGSQWPGAHLLTLMLPLLPESRLPHVEGIHRKANEKSKLTFSKIVPQLHERMNVKRSYKIYPMILDIKHFKEVAGIVS